MFNKQINNFKHKKMKKIKFKTKRIIKIRLSNKSMNINICNKI